MTRLRPFSLRLSRLRLTQLRLTPLRSTRLRVLPSVDRIPVAGAALTLWIAVSPWVWGFADVHPAVANHVALTFGIGPLTLVMANLRPAACVVLLGGGWLALIPWLLGYGGDHVAWANELITGLLLIALSARVGGAMWIPPLRSLRVTRRASDLVSSR